MKSISKLHFITTGPAHAEQACMAGIDWIQLRLKDTPYEEYKAIALEVRAICKQFNATFIINDNVMLAYNIGADGVHLGKEDMPPDSARQLIGDNYIIGSTANTIQDITYLSSMPINYIGLGPYRYTSTKQNLSPILGLEGYQRIFEQIKEQQLNVPPLIGIGGITNNDLPELLTTGLFGVAVSGAISGSGDIVAATRALRSALFTV